MPNFSSLAGLEVAEKFVWGVGWFAQSFSCQTQPLCCVGVGVLTIVHIKYSAPAAHLITGNFEPNSAPD